MPTARVVLPSPPLREISSHDGKVMTAWMDLRKGASYSDKTSVELIKRGRIYEFLQRIYNKYD